MYTAMLGAAAFMNWSGGLKTARGILWFAVAGVLGWPFASALCFPYILEETVIALFSDSEGAFQTFVRFTRGVVAGLFVVVSDLPKC
jgi:alpha-1,2-mannosyltransferase